MNQYTANIDNGSGVHQCNFQAENKSQVIEQIWETFGISVHIIDIFAVEAEIELSIDEEEEVSEVE